MSIHPSAASFSVAYGTRSRPPAERGPAASSRPSRSSNSRRSSRKLPPLQGTDAPTHRTSGHRTHLQGSFPASRLTQLSNLCAE